MIYKVHYVEKFTITVGDELSAGILKLAKVDKKAYKKKRKLKVGDKWQDVTVTKVCCSYRSS
jgi:hypothetical protein